MCESYTYLEDATLFQYTESKHRPDKFRFVDLPEDRIWIIRHVMCLFFVKKSYFLIDKDVRTS